MVQLIDVMLIPSEKNFSYFNSTMVQLIAEEDAIFSFSQK